MKYQGQTVYVPLGKGFDGIVHGEFNEQRSTHKHAGIDFGATKGTEAMSISDGTVITAGWISGFGNTVQVEFPNGQVALYGHLSAFKVKLGDKVIPGQVVGLTGDSGSPGSYHLHFGVYTSASTSAAALDPVPFLKAGGGIRQPGVTPVRTAGTQPPSQALPRGSVMLSDGSFLYAGMRYDRYGKQIGIGVVPEGVKLDAKQTALQAKLTGQRATGAPPGSAGNGTPSQPLRLNSMPNKFTPKDIRPPNASDNYGHDWAAQPHNRAFVQGIHRIAYNLKIPAVALMDIIDLETNGKLNATNRFGMQGVIQFSPETRANLEQRLGRKLPLNNPVGQLPFVELYLNEFKGRMKTVEDVAAAVLGGAPLFNMTPTARPSWGRDGNGTSFPDYMKKLGADVKRRYETTYDRRSASVHTQYHPGCVSCEGLLRSGSFAAHFEGLA